MSHKLRNEINDCPGSPPGAGRTVSGFYEIIEGPANYCFYCGEWHRHEWHRAPEHDANAAPSNGNRTGIRFSWRSHLDTLATLGLGLIVVSVLLTIMAARTAHHFDGWRCRPGEVATTNGRELCPAHGARR